MSIDLSDGSFDPIMDDAEVEASDIVRLLQDMSVEEYSKVRNKLLESASRLHDLRGGTW